MTRIFKATTLVFAGALMLGAASGGQAFAQEAKASYTSAQAARGATEYKRSCLDCHGAGLDDGEFGGAPLKGNGFKEKWFGTTVDSLYGYISSAMPPDRPGRLSPAVYADLTAYILSKNGVQAGTSELPSDIDAQSKLMLD